MLSIANFFFIFPLSISQLFFSILTELSNDKFFITLINMINDINIDKDVQKAFAMIYKK